MYINPWHCFQGICFWFPPLWWENYLYVIFFLSVLILMKVVVICYQWVCMHGCFHKGKNRLLGLPRLPGSQEGDHGEVSKTWDYVTQMSIAQVFHGFPYLFEVLSVTLSINLQWKDGLRWDWACWTIWSAGRSWYWKGKTLEGHSTCFSCWCCAEKS